MLLNCVLFYSLEKSQWVFFLFSSFFFISVSFFSQKKISFRKISFKKDPIILSLSEESLLFYIFFGKAIREKMIFACLKKQEKNITFLNVLVFPVSLLIRSTVKLKTLKHWLVYLPGHIPVLSETLLWNCLNFKELLPWDKHDYQNKWLEWDSLSKHCL